MGEKYEIPRMPESHTVDAHQLRRIHRHIDTLAWRREHTPVSAELAETIDALVSAWEPVRDQLVRETSDFHAEQRRLQVEHIAESCAVEFRLMQTVRIQS